MSKPLSMIVFPIYVQQSLTPRLDTAGIRKKILFPYLCDTLFGENLDLALKAEPYFINTSGMGVIRRARKPRREDAHWVPRRSYI